MYRLKTVDVWDTLIRRLCHPEAIKLAVAQHVFFKFDNSMKIEFIDHWAIYRERLDIERKLADAAQSNGGDAEYRIEEVLHCLMGAVTQGLSEETLAYEAVRLADYELDLEIRNTIPDEEIWALLEQHPSEKTIYLSDFYMGADRLNRLLSHHGLLQKLEGGIVSCDVMLTKRSGRLFQYVHEQLGMTATGHLHIGDNPYADVETPRRLGIEAIEYVPGRAHAARLDREKIFSTRDNLFRYVQGLTSTLLARDNSQKIAFQTGTQAAPLLIAFALFVAERAIKDGLDHIFFCAPEGEFLHRVYDTLFPDRTYAGHALPNGNMLKISPETAFRAFLEVSDSDDRPRLWSSDRQRTASEVLNTLGLSYTDVSPLLSKYVLEAGTKVRAPIEDFILHSFLFDQSIQKIFEGTAEKQKALLEFQIEKGRVTKGGRLALVCFSKNSINQDDIENISNFRSISGYQIGVLSFIQKLIDSSQKYARELYRVNDSDAVPDPNFTTVEHLFCSSQGQLSRHFQDGVVAAIEIAAPVLRLHAVSSAELIPSARKIWCKLTTHAPEQWSDTKIVLAWGDMTSKAVEEDKAQPPSSKAILAALTSDSRGRHIIGYLRQFQQIQAIGKSGLGPIDRIALHSVFWLKERLRQFRSFWDKS